MAFKSKEYESYINSFDWYLKRRAALDRASNKCQRCNSIVGLEVHHLNYDRLGDEKDSDLLVVCKPCHDREDKKRATRTENNFWNSRVHGWASKKYGEDWQCYKDWDEVEEEFEEWLENRSADDDDEREEYDEGDK